MVPQKTIARAVAFEGVGLQTGEKVKVSLKPAKAGGGIRFTRLREGQRSEEILSQPGAIPIGATRRSVLGRGDARVETVEHLMAALYALGVSNLAVEVEGPELPGLDGSAKEFVRILQRAGIETQERECDVYRVVEPLFCAKPEAALAVFPAQELRITYTLDYPRSGLKPQIFSSLIDEKHFVKNIAPARTFCLESEAEALRAQGYGRGATHENTIVLRTDGKPVEGSLRFSDECVRHKVLDLVGDLALLGFRLEGHVIGVRSGHRLNQELVRLLWNQREKNREEIMGQHVSNA